MADETKLEIGLGAAWTGFVRVILVVLGFILSYMFYSITESLKSLDEKVNKINVTLSEISTMVNGHDRDIERLKNK